MSIATSIPDPSATINAADLGAFRQELADFRTSLLGEIRSIVSSRDAKNQDTKKSKGSVWLQSGLEFIEGMVSGGLIVFLSMKLLKWQ